MSRVHDLIADVNPQGVEFKSLGELLAYQQPGKYLVSSTQYDDSFDTPVLTAGQSFILGYTDETAGVYPASKSDPVIIFDDFTTAFRWVDFPFKAKSSAMKMLTPRPGLKADFKFIYYAMRCIGFTPKDHSRHWISQYSAFRIPFPPLHIQHEIVRVLDSFTDLRADLEAELEAELKARHRQHQHYRDMLLSFSERTPADAGKQTRTRWSTLAHIVGFINGKPHERLVDTEGDIALMTSRFISTQGKSSRFVKRPDVLTPALANDIALVMSDLPNGRALARAFFVDKSDRYAANQRVCLLRVLERGQIEPKFLYYVVDRNQQLLEYDSGVDQTHLKREWILQIQVPVPPLDEQKRIVAILDKLDAFVKELSVTLPAELNARRQQYEYYRNRLLSFREGA